MGKYNTNVYKDDKDRKHFLIPSTFSVLNSLGYCCCFPAFSNLFGLNSSSFYVFLCSEEKYNKNENRRSRKENGVWLSVGCVRILWKNFNISLESSR